MNQHRNTTYVTVSLTPEARAALRQIAITMSASCSQQLPMSTAVMVAAKLTAQQDDRHILAAAEQAGVIDSHTTTSAR